MCALWRQFKEAVGAYSTIAAVITVLPTFLIPWLHLPSKLSPPFYFGIIMGSFLGFGITKAWTRNITKRQCQILCRQYAFGWFSALCITVGVANIYNIYLVRALNLQALHDIFNFVNLLPEMTFLMLGGSLAFFFSGWAYLGTSEPWRKRAWKTTAIR